MSENIMDTEANLIDRKLQGMDEITMPLKTKSDAGFSMKSNLGALALLSKAATPLAKKKKKKKNKTPKLLKKLSIVTSNDDSTKQSSNKDKPVKDEVVLSLNKKIKSYFSDEEDDFWDLYSLGNEDESEFDVPYSELTGQKVNQRIIYLWRHAYLKLKAGAKVRKLMVNVRSRVVLMGTTINLMADQYNEIKFTKSMWGQIVLRSDDEFHQYWDCLIVFFLMYTAFIDPF